jgi:hypothetical protein
LNANKTIKLQQMQDQYSQYPAPSIEEGASEIVFSLSARLGEENIDIHATRAIALSFLRNLGHEGMGSYMGWIGFMKDEATNIVQARLLSWPRRKRIVKIKMRFVGVLMSAYWKTLDKRFAPDARHFDTCKLKYKHLIEPDRGRHLSRSKSLESLLDSAKWHTKLNHNRHYT